jgi:hypothetical protein
MNAGKIYKNIGTGEYIRTWAHPETLADTKTLVHPKTLADTKTLAHAKTLAHGKN